MIIFLKLLDTQEIKKLLANGNKYVDLIDHSKISNCLLNNDFTHLLITVPPDDKGDSFYLNYRDLLNNKSKFNWIGYLSATNVYGDHGGEYVDEKSKTSPSTQKGKNRLLAENQWLSYCKDLNFPIHIFRIAGIYGPDRNIMKRIYEKKILDMGSSSQFFSRIHIDDLTSILIASMLKPNPFSIYKVADDLPSSLNDLIEYVCSELNISVPLKINNQNENKKSFFSENKKIDNSLIKKELGIDLKYANYFEGYKKIIESIN
jgi:nucleoside-diphosphate-sugar epimerase